MNADEIKFSFKLMEDEARKFINFSFDDPGEILADLDKAKEDAANKRKVFVEKVNSDSKLLNNLIKNPLGTLRKNNMLDRVRSVTVNFPTELIAADPPFRICVELECVEEHIEMLCLEYYPTEIEGFGKVCRKYVLAPVCDRWVLNFVPCD